MTDSPKIEAETGYNEVGIIYQQKLMAKWVMELSLKAYRKVSMKTKHRVRIIAVTVVSVCLLCVFSSFATGEYKEGSIHYTLGDSGNAIITEYDSGDENVIIPSAINGHPVVAIGSESFYEDTVIKTVSLPEGIKTIGDNAFYNCYNLTDINIPSTVTELGQGSFYRVQFKEVTIPEGITEIPYSCFSYCKLTDVHLPNTIKIIRAYSFAYCLDLKYSVSLIVVNEGEKRCLGLKS